MQKSGWVLLIEKTSGAAEKGGEREMSISKNLAIYIKKKGINISAMSRTTGIDRGKLHMSLSETVEDDSKRRPLRDDELLAFCKAMEVSPDEFLKAAAG